LSGPYGSNHQVTASLDQDAAAGCTVIGVPASNAAPDNYLVSANCSGDNYTASGTATYVVTASTAAIEASVAAPVGVVTVDPMPNADAKKSNYTWKTTGSVSEPVLATFTV